MAKSLAVFTERPSVHARPLGDKTEPDYTLAEAQFAELTQLLADRVKSVAREYHVGVLVGGRPGTGKTHTVEQTLDEIDANRVPTINGRLSPAALFDEIEEHSNSVLVIDDVPTLFKNPQALQILLAALGGKPGTPRRVTYKTKKETRVAYFTGGIIAISNVALAGDPVARALASRMVMLEYAPTDEMLLAFIRRQAADGVGDVKPREAQAVLEHVVAEIQQSEQRLDLRHFYKGIEDFRFWRNDKPETDWRTLVSSSLREMATDELAGQKPTSKGDEIEAEIAFVGEMLAAKLSRDEMLDRWKDRTGKGDRTFYHRHKEAIRRHRQKTGR